MRYFVKVFIVISESMSSCFLFVFLGFFFLKRCCFILILFKALLINWLVWIFFQYIYGYIKNIVTFNVDNNSCLIIANEQNVGIGLNRFVSNSSHLFSLHSYLQISIRKVRLFTFSSWRRNWKDNRVITRRHVLKNEKSKRKYRWKRKCKLSKRNSITNEWKMKKRRKFRKRNTCKILACNMIKVREWRKQLRL